MATAEVLEVEPGGARIVRLSDEGIIDRIGSVPLPPYIREPLGDAERYQTVYARAEGSVAAPTAGLHFTGRLLDGVRSRGVETVFVTLHVGWDSFRPVRQEDPSAHRMHSEWWELGPAAAGPINRAKSEGRRVVSVGTTAVRLLEHAAALGDGRRDRDVGSATLVSLHGRWGYADRPGAAPPGNPRNPPAAGRLQRRSFRRHYRLGASVSAPPLR